MRHVERAAQGVGHGVYGGRVDRTEAHAAIEARQCHVVACVQIGALYNRPLQIPSYQFDRRQGKGVDKRMGELIGVGLYATTATC